MNFDEILKDIVKNTEGALSATLMGFDGIAVASYIREEARIEIETMAIEYTRVISEISRTAKAIEAGSVRDISISTDNYLIAFYILHGNYFVALLMKSGANMGKGKYLLRKTAPDIIAQL